MQTRFPPGVHRVHRTAVLAAMGMAAIALAYESALYAQRGRSVFLWSAGGALLLLVSLGFYLRWFMRRTSPLR